MNCPNCNADNPDNAAYCSQCGTALAAQESEAQSGQGQRVDQPEGHYGDYLPMPGVRAADDLIPRNLGELINETIAVYRANFGTLLWIALVAQIPFFLGDFSTSDALELSYIVAALFTGLLANGATTYAVSQHYLKRRVNAGTCYVAALNSSLSLLGAFLVYWAVLIAAGFLSVILIGIPIFVFVAVAWVFSAQAIMVERYGPIAALYRSWGLVRGNWWRVFAIGVVFVVLLVVAGFVASIPGVILGLANTTLGNLLGTLGSVFVAPAGYVGATLVYFDLRIKKEGYNLETLTSEIG